MDDLLLAWDFWMVSDGVSFASAYLVVSRFALVT